MKLQEIRSGLNLSGVEPAEFVNVVATVPPGDGAVLPMIWDYAEKNPFAGAGGDIYGTTHSLCEVLDKLPVAGSGTVAQADAAVQSMSPGRIVSTDPPYYDNVAYGDRSDFFYVWLRRAMKPVFPELSPCWRYRRARS